LEEKSTASKLDILDRKSLYLLALNLASMQKLDKFSLIFTGNMETTSIAKAI
jgi:hypothetical protein